MGNGMVHWANHPEKCLDVTEHQNRIGTPLQISDCTYHDFDKYFFLDTSVRPPSATNIPAPVGRLRWNHHPRKCVVAQNGGAWNGNSIVLTECASDSWDQYWAL